MSRNWFHHWRSFDDHCLQVTPWHRLTWARYHMRGYAPLRYARFVTPTRFYEVAWGRQCSFHGHIGRLYWNTFRREG